MGRKATLNYETAFASMKMRMEFEIKYAEENVQKLHKKALESDKFIISLLKEQIRLDEKKKLLEEIIKGIEKIHTEHLKAAAK